MNRWFVRVILVAVCLLAFPFSSPAPLVYRPGEGWVYEPVGGGKWVRSRAKDQVEVASDALEQKNYSLAMRASRYTVKTWPLSDYAPQAQYIIARCYEAEKKDEKAFAAYQQLLEKYPKVTNYDEVVRRQFEIANRYLAGQWFKLWGYIPFFPSMERTAEMYEKLIKNGPYSEVAPQAQMNIGAAQEKRAEYTQAVKAYEKAADRYNDRKQVASDATYKAALAYNRQAQTAEYDQGIAQKAIVTFNDFMALYPDDPRVPEAQRYVDTLKTEQARGAYKIAQYYEKLKRYEGALVYYNEVLIKDANSIYAIDAKQRIEILRARTWTPPTEAPATNAPAATAAPAPAAK